MGVVVRQGIKGSIVSYGGTLLGYLNIIILFPLILTTEQIGLYKVLIDAAGFFIIFAQLGMSNVSIKFFPYFKNIEKQHNGFLFVTTIVPLIGFIVFSLLMWGFKDELLHNFSEKSPLLLEYSHYLIPLSFAMLFLVILATYSRSLLRIVVPKFLREILVRLIITIGAILYYFEIIDFSEFIVCMVGGYGLALISIIGYLRSLKQWFVRPKLSFIDKKLSKEMGMFSLFMLLGTGGGVIVGKIDTLMLSSLEGLNQTGIYGIAFYIAAVMELPRRVLVEIATPLISSAFKNEDQAKVLEVYQKTSLNMLLIGGLCFIGIWANIDSIFQLIPNSPAFESGKIVVFIIGIAKLFDMSMGLNSEIISNSNYYKWNIFLMPFLAVVAIGTNLLFIPQYGITGAAIATFISIISYNIIRYVLVLIKLKIQPFTTNTIKAIIAIISGWGIHLLLPSFENFILDIFVRSIAITAAFGAVVIYLKPSETIDEIIDAFLKKIGIRKS